MDNIFKMDPNESVQKAAVCKTPVRKTPKPKAIPDCKIIVRTHSPLFDPLQVGIKEDPTKFKFRDNFEDLKNAPHQNLDNMFIQRYEVAPDNIVLRLISYNTPMAQVSSKGNVEVLGVRISNSTTQHITRFIRALCNQEFTFQSLVKSYGVGMLTPIPVQPVVFPRVTVGMINKAIKATQKACGCYDGENEIRVNSQNLDIVEIHLPTGNVQIWYTDNNSLREVLRILINRGWLDYRFILEANKPENIKKYFRS